MDYRIVHYRTCKKIGLGFDISQNFPYCGNFIAFYIPSYSTDLEHCIAVPVTGYHFEKVEDRLTVFPGPHKDRIISKEMTCKSDP